MKLTLDCEACGPFASQEGDDTQTLESWAHDVAVEHHTFHKNDDASVIRWDWQTA